MANLFAAYMQPPQTMGDYAAQMDQNDLRKLQIQNVTGQNALLELTRAQQAQQAQQQIETQRRLGAILSNQQLTDPAQRESAMLGDPYLMDKGLAFQKQRLDNANTQAQTRERGSVAAKNDTETRIKNHEQGIMQLMAYGSPDEAKSYLTRQVAGGQFGMDEAQRIMSSIPSDPQAFKLWKLQQVASLANPEQFVSMNKPVVRDVNTGGQTQTLAIDPMTGQTRVTGALQNTQSPDNAATNSSHLAGISMQQRGENMRAGVNPDGSMSNDMESTAKAIAAGQLPPPTGVALLNPRNQRLLARVMEVNPGYDFTDVTAKKAAATAFTSGSQGNALRAVSTANAHLDQLGELVDALDNGNIPLINKAANAYTVNTGKPAPTNFDSVKNVIGQEVVKAIVAGGGSAGERDEAAKAFSKESSPQQLKGAIQHYRMIMGAQEDNLMAQRRAAGLSDRTLPQYNTSAQSQGGGMPSISDIDAEIARRKGK